jgi:hypothetical protein
MGAATVDWNAVPKSKPFGHLKQMGSGGLKISWFEFLPHHNHVSIFGGNTPSER